MKKKKEIAILCSTVAECSTFITATEENDVKYTCNKTVYRKNNLRSFLLKDQRLVKESFYQRIRFGIKSKNSNPKFTGKL